MVQVIRYNYSVCPAACNFPGGLINQSNQLFRNIIGHMLIKHRIFIYQSAGAVSLYGKYSSFLHHLFLICWYTAAIILRHQMHLLLCNFLPFLCYTRVYVIAYYLLSDCPDF